MPRTRFALRPSDQARLTAKIQIDLEARSNCLAAPAS